MPSSERVIILVSMILYLIFGYAFIKRKQKQYYMRYNIVFWTEINKIISKLSVSQN